MTKAEYVLNKIAGIANTPLKSLIRGFNNVYHDHAVMGKQLIALSGAETKAPSLNHAMGTLAEGMLKRDSQIDTLGHEITKRTKGLDGYSFGKN